MTTDNRFSFLKHVYEASGGDETKQVNAASVAMELGFNEDELRKITQYLNGEGLLNIAVVLHRIPAFVTISHAGIKAAEAGSI